MSPWSRRTERPVGYLTIRQAGRTQPLVSTMNSLDGRTKANAAIVPAGASGAVSIFVTNTANVVLDIDGYFAPPSAQTLQFYPLTPCRVADTRKSNFPQGLGTPHLSQGVARDFPVLSAISCNIPASAQAYSLNFTAIPYPSHWATSPAGLPGNLADRGPAATSRVDPQQSDSDLCGECGHRSCGQRRKHYCVRQRRHRLGH